MVNRAFLALSGLVLAGCAVVWARFQLDPAAARGSGRPWRAFGSATDVLAEWRSQNWWPVSACAVAAVASVLLALWCVRQATRGTRATVPLATRGAVTLRSALERAVTEEVLKTGEVAGCRTRITSEGRRLRMRMKIRLHREATPDRALAALGRVLAQVDDIMAPQTVRADVRFASSAGRGARRGAVPGRRTVL